jgi:hypothetical protein
LAKIRTKNSIKANNFIKDIIVKPEINEVFLVNLFTISTAAVPELPDLALD